MSLDCAQEALEAAQVCKEISMAKPTGISTNYRSRLGAAVTAFSLFMRDLYPEARLEISFVRYEDEDAHIWISLPSILTEEEREEFANRVAEKSLDILLAEGFLILAGVEEPESTSLSPSTPNVCSAFRLDE